MNLLPFFEQQQQTFQANPYPSTQQRKERLLALKKILQLHGVDLAQAVDEDFSHRSIDETLFLEIFPSIKAIEFCMRHVHRWSKIRKRSLPWYLQPAQAYLFPQPLGVVGIMVPWNYPIYLLAVPLAYALAAGNHVLIKCSELTPHTGQLLAEYIAKNPLLQSVITIINGNVQCSQEFSALPFGHLMFTGSTAVGKQIMATASLKLTPLTLELGGKSPAIVARTANPKQLKRLFMGKMFNAGQTCVAPDYLLVHKLFESSFASLFREFLEQHYPNSMENKDFSHIISATHEQRLQGLVEDAILKGAQIIQFDEENKKDRKFPVTLILHANQSMRVMQEEIFGPLLPIVFYNHFAEVLDLIDQQPQPLALYYFGKDAKEIKYLEEQCLSGALVLNDSVIHTAIDDLPFGGVGQSGMGSYHGIEGFDTFSHLKPVFKQKKYASVSLFYPPYGKLVHWFLRHFAGISFKEKE